MLAGTKKLFPNDYDDFKGSMLAAAEAGQLPIALQLNEDKGFTIKHFHEMFTEFKQDTGLQITASLFLCDFCDKLHVMLEVDYPEIDESIPVQ